MNIKKGLYTFICNLLWNMWQRPNVLPAVVLKEELIAYLFLSESNCRTEDTTYLVENKAIYLLIPSILTSAVAEF